MFNYKISSLKQGYTLIELMVAISIVGFLSSMILVSLEDAKNQARYTVAKQELVEIANAIYLAGSQEETLIDITGRVCSACACWLENNSTLSTMHNFPEPHINDDGKDCMLLWRDTMSKIADESPLLDDGHEKLLRDPWGAPYLLNENEGEIVGDECHWDHIRTAGADGDKQTADDYVLKLPYRTDQCKIEGESQSHYQPYRF